MYDDLTPLFDQVTDADLTQYFKSERFGVDTAGPGTEETVPHAGVSIAPGGPACRERTASARSLWRRGDSPGPGKPQRQ